MSATGIATAEAPVLRPDGCLACGSTVIESWPSLRMRPERSLSIAQAILKAQRGDPLWPFVVRIPARLRELACRAPGRGWELLELAAAAPERGAELIRQCPALALLIVQSHTTARGSTDDYYSRILVLTWRQILGTLGLPAERRYVRILRKLPLGHCDDATLGSLAAAMAQRHPHLRILSHMPRVSADTVALLTLPPPLTNGRLLQHSGSSRVGEMPVYWCVETVSCLRELEFPGREWCYHGLDLNRLQKVEYRLRSMLDEGDPMALFPEPPLPGVPGFVTPLTNYASSRKFRHEPASLNLAS
jgi:hypothetical protein